MKRPRRPALRRMPWLLLLALAAPAPPSLRAQGGWGSGPGASPGRETLRWSGLAAPFPSGVTAADGDGEGGVVLFRGLRWVRYSQAEGATVAAGDVGRWPAWPPAWSRVDAALAWDPERLLLISGNTFVWFAVARQEVLGVPQPISAWGLPWVRVDAAVRWDETTLLFFRGGEYMSYDTARRAAQGPFRLSAWPGWPPAWAGGVEAAADPGDGRLYFFRAGSLLAYDRQSGRFESGRMSTEDPASPPELPEPPVQTAHRPPPAAPDPSPAGDESAAPERSARQRLAETGGLERPAPVSLLRLSGERGQGIHQRDGRLALREEGTLSFWVAARWQDDTFEDPDGEVYLLTYGNSGQTGYKVYINAARDRIGLRNGAEQFDDVRFPFHDGALHHVALITRGRKTQVVVDGKSEEIEVGYIATTGNLELSIGPEPFLGDIGAVRIWNRALSPGTVEALKALPDRELRSGRESFNLIAYQENRPGGLASAAAGSLVVLDPALDPAGLWAEDRERQRTRPDDQFDFTFEPMAFYHLQWADESSELVRLAADGRQVPSGPRGEEARLLVMTRVQPGAEPAFELLRRVDRQTFQSPWSGRPRLRMERGDGVDLDGTSLRRADRALQGPVEQDRAGDTFARKEVLKEVPVNIELNSRAYDVLELDPSNLRHTGSDRKIFAGMTPDEMDPGSGAWRVQGGAVIPFGLERFLVDSGTGRTDMEEVMSEKEYHDSLAQSFGGTVANLSRNTAVKAATETIYRERRMHAYQRANNVRHVLVLDLPNARLNEDFLLAVANLKQARDPAGFVRDFGTHYAHAIAYGGRAFRDLALEENTYSAVKMREKHNGIRFEQAIEISVTATAGAGLVSVSGTVGTTEKFGFHDEETHASSSASRGESKRETTAWIVDGGRAGANLESWNVSDDTLAPVFVDLRPIHELLVPPFFDDVEVITRVRAELKRYLDDQLQPLPLRTEPVFRWTEPATLPVVEVPRAPEPTPAAPPSAPAPARCDSARYGRGAGYGYVPLFEERKDARTRCEREHGRGNCERHLEMYYPKCKAGYHAVGCCICECNG